LFQHGCAHAELFAQVNLFDELGQFFEKGKKKLCAEVGVWELWGCIVTDAILSFEPVRDISIK
jgi:hypothetical protein